MHQVNEFSCNLLQYLGHDGSILCIKLQKKKTVALTAQHSKEHPEARESVSTHGIFFNLDKVYKSTESLPKIQNSRDGEK